MNEPLIRVEADPDKDAYRFTITGYALMSHSTEEIVGAFQEYVKTLKGSFRSVK